MMMTPIDAYQYRAQRDKNTRRQQYENDYAHWSRSWLASRERYRWFASLGYRSGSHSLDFADADNWYGDYDRGGDSDEADASPPHLPIPDL